MVVSIMVEQMSGRFGGMQWCHDNRPALPSPEDGSGTMRAMIKRPHTLAAALTALSMLGAPSASLAQTASTPPPQALEEVPYVKTPEPVVDAILTLAEIGPGDRLIDLGSGDGRIVIAAARRFGIRALGVEIDPSLVTLSNARAAEAGVADRVRFAAQDLFETDLRDATVITLYLLPDVNLALRPRLLALAPGTRIVSHDWDMGDWPSDRSVEVDAPGKTVGLVKRSKVHRWTVPARIEGRWRGAIDDPAGSRPLEVAFTQRFQQLAFAEDSAQGVRDAPAGRVDGTGVRLALRLDGRDLVLEGTVDGDRLSGRTRLGAREVDWRLRRAR
jgi:SAM-dependent methyltransferase